MSDLKTQKTKASVSAFLNAIEDDQQRKDAKTIAKIMKEVTGTVPAMWGSSIVGFGSYHYKGASGREGDWLRTGFSPRKQNLSVYIMDGFESYGPLLKKLGKHIGKTRITALKGISRAARFLRSAPNGLPRRRPSLASPVLWSPRLGSRRATG